jgi:hypothetical protein
MPEYADVEEVLDHQLSVLLIAEQDAFVVQGNVFCVLAPLMTQEGLRFEDVREQFPNRGKVWWLVGREGAEERMPRHGDLITATLEGGRFFNVSDPDKEKYQVRDWLPGARKWIQVLDIGDRRFPSEVIREEGIEWNDVTPSSPVLIVTGDQVIGPFFASRQPDSEALRIAPQNLGKPVATAMPVAAFLKAFRLSEFDVDIFQGNRRDAPREHRHLRFLSEKHLKAFEQQGKPIDASSDRQIVKWALNQAGFTQAQRTAFGDVLNKVGQLQFDSADGEGRAKRFSELCGNAKLVMGLGSEVAEDLASCEPFKALMQTHIDSLTARRVEAAVASRKADVEAAVAVLEKRRTGLAKEYDEAKRRQEEKLATEHSAWLRRLEEMETALKLREQAIGEKEKSIAQRLERVVEAYRAESVRLGDQILAELPILRRLGLGGTSSGAAPAEPERDTRSIVAPFVARSVPRESITESAFIDQFKTVAAARGFVFAVDDLVNFHVAVKSGIWSVLAGPSGIGKSTLPRLYAEALGMKDEFLKIEVRPDWLDDRDVIGAFNPLAGRFEPSPVGLVDQLIAAYEDAAKSRGGLYLVSLDEMNLARVEHYFAQFLSIMEEPAGTRMIRLFSRGMERAGEPYARYRELPIGDNIRFVGTVNIDETTHFFSPKVLDRAAVLTLNAIDHSRSQGPSLKARDLAVTPVHFDIWKSWIKDGQSAPAAARTLFLEIDKCLRRLHAGLGHRLLNRLLGYVASAGVMLPPDTALDYALMASVLPRVPVHHLRFGEEADKLRTLLPADRFPRSGAMLGRMVEEGGDHGFFQLL